MPEKWAAAVRFRPFLDDLTSGIAMNDLVILMSQIGCLGNIMGVRGRDCHGMHKTAVSGQSNAAFPLKPLLAVLPCLVHLWSRGFLIVLCCLEQHFHNGLRC